MGPTYQSKNQNPHYAEVHSIFNFTHSSYIMHTNKNARSLSPANSILAFVFRMVLYAPIAIPPWFLTQYFLVPLYNRHAFRWYFHHQLSFSAPQCALIYRYYLLCIIPHGYTPCKVP